MLLISNKRRKHLTHPKESTSLYRSNRYSYTLNLKAQISARVHKLRDKCKILISYSKDNYEWLEETDINGWGGK